MTTAHIATIPDVIRAVISSDEGADLIASHAGAAVQIALVTVIGLHCLGDRTLDIDLGNGHFLHCSLKRSIQ